MVLASVVVHGVSIPAHQGIVRTWNKIEARWFPRQYERYLRERNERDKELRAGEEEGEDGRTVVGDIDRTSSERTEAER